MEEEQYILGTDKDELDRLGFQHSVWASDANLLWKRAGITLGKKVLDLGCGPGFASFDLATMVGPEGSVTGVDISPGYIHYAKHQAKVRGFDHIDFIESSFDDLDLGAESFDAIYCRWAMAWIDNVPETIENAAKWLKPGGRFMMHEYLDWGTFRVIPERPEVRRVIEACRKGWQLMDSEIDIGPLLPEYFDNVGLKVSHFAPLARMESSQDLTWQWPGTFLNIYSLKLIEMGILTHEERDAFLPVWDELSSDERSIIVTPLMMEIIGVK